ncbi:hypothetical protein SAMN04488109_1634 [Chryseolinea serpens]|uniref:Uncharacterized protein n=1 Tax=Chryseolinea serpens TaxID=947013 RepID=A0A1M5MAV4_9BACT|nr:hypothetical protein SAMN04488109_1634 [Chryseolinea serpens]
MKKGVYSIGKIIFLSIFVAIYGTPRRRPFVSGYILIDNRSGTS